METCKNCGRPLNDPDEELCAACKAAAAARAPKKNVHHAQRRRMNRTTRNMLIIVCVLAFVFAALCTLADVMYRRYNPADFIAAVDFALSGGDARALEKMLVSDELSVSPEGSAALCRAFAESGPREALLHQFEAQIADETASGDFPALHIVKTPVFFGYCRYSIDVKSVSLLLTAPLQNLILSLDEIPRSGIPHSDGILYDNLFPGLYSCSVSGLTVAGQAVQGNPVQLSLFSPDEPTVFSGAMPVAAVTVSGCIRDDAVITLDGAAVPQKPVNGTVTLPQAVLGSKIGFSYTSPWGSVSTSHVQFDDPAVTSLVFPAPDTRGGIPAAAELDQILTAHYATYLNAINTQDPTVISGCTPEYAAVLAGSVPTDIHKANLYVMQSAVCSPAAVRGTVSPDTALVSCCAKLSYSVTSREKNITENQAEYQIYTLIWQDGWKVSACTPASEEIYNTITPELLP